MGTIERSCQALKNYMIQQLFCLSIHIRNLKECVRRSKKTEIDPFQPLVFKVLLAYSSHILPIGPILGVNWMYFG